MPEVTDPASPLAVGVDRTPVATPASCQALLSARQAGNFDGLPFNVLNFGADPATGRMPDGDEPLERPDDAYSVLRATRDLDCFWGDPETSTVFTMLVVNGTRPDVVQGWNEYLESEGGLCEIRYEGTYCQVRSVDDRGESSQTAFSRGGLTFLVFQRGVQTGGTFFADVVELLW